MPRGGQNRLPVRVKHSYFELIRTGMPGAKAARRVGVSMSCGSLQFIDAGSVSITETHPISSRYISQDDRIEIADGLAAGEPVTAIADRIGKSFQGIYREIARNRKPDKTYQPVVCPQSGSSATSAPEATDPRPKDVAGLRRRRQAGQTLVP